MSPRFANSYIDRLFEEKDLTAIYHLIGVVAKEKSLPEAFWLFCFVYEWVPARSGVWQHYEHLPNSAFERNWEALNRFGLKELAEKYREGKVNWSAPNQAADLDRWLDANAKEIHQKIFDLVARQKDCLRH